MVVKIPYHPMRPFLNSREVAKATGISVRTLARMRKNGTGPKFHRLSLRLVSYSVDELNKWLAEKSSHPDSVDN